MTAVTAPAATTPAVKAVDGRSLAHVLATTDKQVVVVDFWASWCSPCKNLAPQFEQVARERAADADFVKLDTEADLATASQYGVTALPTVLFLEPRTGQVMFQGELRGNVNAALLRRKLDELVTR